MIRHFLAVIKWATPYLGLLLLLGCSSILAEVPLSDGNTLVISGSGTKSNVAQKCLRADAIQKLTSSDIPDDVPKQTCYWVLLASTDSSDISKAITAFIQADDEFQRKIKAVAAPGTTEQKSTETPLLSISQAEIEQEKRGEEIALRLLTSTSSRPTCF